MNRKERTIFVTLIINALQPFFEKTAAPAGGEQQPKTP